MKNKFQILGVIVFNLAVLSTLLASCQSSTPYLAPFTPTTNTITITSIQGITQTQTLTQIVTQSAQNNTVTQTVTLPAHTVTAVGSGTQSTMTITSTKTVTSPPITVTITSLAPTTTSLAPTTIVTFITKNASQMVMTINDYGSGWILSTNNAETKSGATSAYISSFSNTSNMSTVTTEVAVYPDVNTAHQVYLGEIPQSVSYTNPNYGDESFSYTYGMSLLQKLVFRKANVVAWITVANDPYGSPNHAADVVNSRIN